VEKSRVDQTIYHKNLDRVVYVFAETVGGRLPSVLPTSWPTVTMFLNPVRNAAAAG
jgi:hypothetical protein